MDVRKKTALKNMRFTRFILLRYSLALFFFANLNWFIFMLPSRNAASLIPLVMLLGAVFSIKEFLKVYNVKQEITLKNTKFFFTMQLATNLLLMAATINASLFGRVFPFMNADSYGLGGVRGVLIVGALISLFCLRKISVIRVNKDSGYKNYVNFKNSLKVSEKYGE